MQNNNVTWRIVASALAIIALGLAWRNLDRINAVQEEQNKILRELTAIAAGNKERSEDNRSILMSMLPRSAGAAKDQ